MSDSPAKQLESTTSFLPSDASVFVHGGFRGKGDQQDGAVDSLLRDLQMLHYTFSNKASPNSQLQQSPGAEERELASSAEWHPAPSPDYEVDHFEHTPAPAPHPQRSVYHSQDASYPYQPSSPPGQGQQMTYTIPAQPSLPSPMLQAPVNHSYHPSTQMQLMASPHSPHHSASFERSSQAAPLQLHAEPSNTPLRASASKSGPYNPQDMLRDSLSSLHSAPYSPGASRRDTGSLRSTREYSSSTLMAPPGAWQAQGPPPPPVFSRQAHHDLQQMQQERHSAQQHPMHMPPPPAQQQMQLSSSYQQPSSPPHQPTRPPQLIHSPSILRQDDPDPTYSVSPHHNAPAMAAAPHSPTAHHFHHQLHPGDSAATAALQQQVQGLEQQLQQLQQEKAELEAQLLRSQGELSAAVQRRHTIEEKQDELREAMTDVEKAAKGSAKDLELVNKQLSAKMQEVKQVQEQLAAERAAHQGCRDSLSSAKDTISDLQKQLTALDKKLHSTAEECRKLDAEVMALRRDASSHSSTAQRAQQELAEGRDKLRAAQYEAQRRCQQAEAEKAALAEQLAALTDHLQGVEAGRAAAQQDAQMAFDECRQLREEVDASRAAAQQDAQMAYEECRQLQAQVDSLHQQLEQQHATNSALAAESAAATAAAAAAREELRSSMEMHHMSYSVQHAPGQQQQPWQQYTSPLNSDFPQQYQYQPQGVPSYAQPGQPRAASPGYSSPAYKDFQSYPSRPNDTFTEYRGPVKSPNLSSDQSPQYTTSQVRQRSYSNPESFGHGPARPGYRGAAEGLAIRSTRAISDPVSSYPAHYGSARPADTGDAKPRQAQAPYATTPPAAGPYAAAPSYHPAQQGGGSYGRPADPGHMQYQHQRQEEYSSRAPAGAAPPGHPHAASPFPPLAPEGSQGMYQEQQRQPPLMAERSAAHMGLSAQPSSRSVADHYNNQQQQPQQGYGAAAEAGPSGQPAAKDSPFGTEYTLQDMMARTKALEGQLMAHCREKDSLEAEYAKMPQHGGRTLRERQRKSEVEGRMEELAKAISATRLQLKKLLGK